MGNVRGYKWRSHAARRRKSEMMKRIWAARGTNPEHPVVNGYFMVTVGEVVLKINSKMNKEVQIG